MKRVTVLFLIVISALFAVNGQQYSIGFKPSFLIIGAKYTEEPEIMGLNLTSRSSYGFGFTFIDQINRRIGLKIEPRFIAKGYNIKWDSENEDLFINNYLSLPILFDFSPLKNFSFEVGPDIGYLFSSGVKPYGNNSFQKNDSQNLKKIEFSLITGACYSFLNRFDFGARYGFALTASEEGTFTIQDWMGPDRQADYKFVQHYFELYLNTRFWKMSKKN